MKLIVGLGNPGKEYENTRHNVGFLVIDELERRGLPPGVKVLKPDTYMNRSGEAVVKALRQTNMTPADVIAVFDDADMEFGNIRFRSTGSAGGHNGMRSIMELLGTNDVARVKVGIGRDPSGHVPLDAWVLGKWTKEEKLKLQDAIAKAADRVTEWLK